MRNAAAVLVLGLVFAVGCWRAAPPAKTANVAAAEPAEPTASDINDPQAVLADLAKWKPTLTGNALTDKPVKEQEAEHRAAFIGKPFKWRLVVGHVNELYEVVFTEEGRCWPFKSCGEFEAQPRNENARDFYLLAIPPIKLPADVAKTLKHGDKVTLAGEVVAFDRPKESDDVKKKRRQADQRNPGRYHGCDGPDMLLRPDGSPFQKKNGEHVVKRSIFTTLKDAAVSR